MADIKEAARERVEQSRDELVALSRRIHANPELGFEEEQACAWLCELLDGAGLEVERGVGDLPTAFAARAGSGPLHVVVCAEYDALPAVGHACGHNVIAAMAAGAGLALAKVADDAGLRVTVLGTPAEEGGGGKILLLERGAFEGAHAAMMVHPSPLRAGRDADHRREPPRGRLHRQGGPRLGLPVPGDQRGRRPGRRPDRHRPAPPAPAPRRPGARDRHQGRRRRQRDPGPHRRPSGWSGPRPWSSWRTSRPR